MIRILLLAALLTVFLASAASAQVFHQYPGAPTVERTRLDVGAFLSGGEDLFRFGGYGRLGLAKYWDAGLEAVVDVVDGSWRGGLGGDIRYQLFPTTEKLPFDLTADAAFGFTSGDGVTIFHGPLGAVISSPLKTDGGTIITPYLGVYAVYVRTEVDVSGAPSTSNNDVEAMLRGGASIEFGERLVFFGMLQLGPDDLVSVGVNYNL